ncbi:phosphatidate cytidylyltransferase [Microbacterium sp. 1P10UB]|uniref:phosphatidate cytidylyltransferase n=1 Tax=unclassified Microbacterium TaxID=2609290 RepID=UPI0039A06486
MTDAPGAEPTADTADDPALTPSRRDAATARRAQPEGSVRADGGDFSAQVRAARTEFESQVAHARAEFDQANERLKERTGRDLIVAIAIALAIGAVLVASLIFFKWGFVLFALGASTLGIFELARALQTTGRRLDLVPQLVAGTLLVAAGLFLASWLHWISLFLAVAFVIVWRLIAQMVANDGRTYAGVLGDVLIAGFVQLYVPFLASLCVLLLRQEGGEWWVLAFIIVVVASDTGAYSAGLAFGKHPMAPKISPKKTWEGFAGAAAAALIAGVLVALFMLGLPWWCGLIFGALILVTATAGDLGESMVKRDLGIKDMSSWLPGHGGVLDRLDSILPSVAAALALFYLLSPLAAS